MTEGLRRSALLHRLSTLLLLVSLLAAISIAAEHRVRWLIALSSSVYVSSVQPDSSYHASAITPPLLAGPYPKLMLQHRPMVGYPYPAALPMDPRRLLLQPDPLCPPEPSHYRYIYE